MLADDRRQLADLYSDEAWDAAIGRRNIAWARWQSVRAQWEFAGCPTGPLLGALNEAQHNYEHAARDLIRARVWWKAGLARRELPIAV